MVPDFSQITLADLGNLPEEVIIGPEFNNLVGYDFSRVYPPEDPDDPQNLTTFLKGGDVVLIFEAGDLTLNEILELAELDPEDIPLEDFRALTEESLADFIAGLPDDEQEDIEIEDVPVLEEIFGDDNSSQDIGSLADGNGNLDSASLEELGDLSDFSLADIGELGEIPIKEIPAVLDAFINDVPGLSEVPLASFPSPVGISDGVGIGRIDFITGDDEEYTEATLSGPDCNGGNCPHIEIWAPGNVVFAGRWVVTMTEAGEFSQLIPGGHGSLSGYGGGTEPPGTFPLSNKNIKVILREKSLEDDTVDLGFTFRFCLPFQGCTPYNLPTKSGVLLFSIERDQLILY